MFGLNRNRNLSRQFVGSSSVFVLGICSLCVLLDWRVRGCPLLLGFLKSPWFRLRWPHRLVTWSHTFLYDAETLVLCIAALSRPVGVTPLSGNERKTKRNDGVSRMCLTEIITPVIESGGTTVLAVMVHS